MNDQQALEGIMTAMCRASALAGRCPYCEPGKPCDPRMWKTFQNEALAVWNFLVLSGRIVPQQVMNKTVLHR